jgi:diadenylate cyclase
MNLSFHLIAAIVWDLIEVTILSVGIYWIWKLFRGTRGARVLAGFGFLLALLSLVSFALHLTVIGRLLSFSPLFLLTSLVIIFQPELRRIFAEVGSRPIFSPHRHQAEQLQLAGHGALIAFEREITYEPARETGTALDAQVSDDLLATIFFPKTPLHDGGVIIVQDRIALAAGIFPLTQSEGLQRTLGLRHRAALGMSEETDAAVVVLSEETGIISLAHNGELRRPLTTDELRAQLVAILLNRSDEKSLVPQLAS